MRRQLGLGLLCAMMLGTPVALAQGKVFNFRDPKGVNSMAFTLDSEVEPIRGLAAGVSGEVTFDAANPKATTGTLMVEAKSLRTPNEKMDEVLYSEEWLDVAKNPDITFKFKEVVEATPGEGGQMTLEVKGDFTLKGITKELTIPVRATLLEGKLDQRQRGKGDLLVLRAAFEIDRKDFDIKKDYGPVVVAEKIQITAQIVGIHAIE